MAVTSTKLLVPHEKRNINPEKIFSFIKTYLLYTAVAAHSWIHFTFKYFFVFMPLEMKQLLLPKKKEKNSSWVENEEDGKVRNKTH